MKNKILQKDYSVFPRNYQLKLSSEWEVMLPADESVRLLSEVMEELDYTSLYRAYAVKGRGDSMNPRFFDGQIVWIHEQPDLASGEIGIFFYEGESYIKQLERNLGALRLISLNPSYSPIEIRDFESFRIFGKVVG